MTDQKNIQRFGVRRTVCALSAIVAGSLAVGCGVQQAAPSAAAVQAAGHGFVHGGQQPVQNSVIQLYAVGTGSYGASSTPLLTSSVATLADGSFNITGLFSCPSPSTLIYIVSSGGNPGLATGTNNPNLALMSAIGRCDSLTASSTLQINEVTTVAAVAALAQYMTGYANVGAPASDTGMAAAFALAAQLASAGTGTAPGTNVPANATVPVTLINSLANIVSTCVNSSGGTAGDTTPCGRLFSTMQANGYTAATDTVGYLIRVSQSPALDTGAMFNLISPTAVFLPQLTAAPPTFAVALGYASALTLSVSNATFPATYVTGFSPSQAVTITNTSASTVTLSSVAIMEPSGGSDFIVLSNCPSSLLAAVTHYNTCTAWVNFTPQTAGTLSSYLAVSGSTSTAYAAFSGTAVSNPPAAFSNTLNNQTVFIGASICQNWSLPIHNAGHAGDTTGQIAARFPSAVLNQGYSTVVIMGGSNDILDGIPANASVAEVQSMAQMAANAGMQVAIAAIPPMYIPNTDYSAAILSLNQGYEQLAEQNGWLYLDFYTPLVGYPQDFSDGLHPNAAGYAVMLPVVTANITH